MADIILRHRIALDRQRLPNRYRRLVVGVLEMTGAFLHRV